MRSILDEIQFMLPTRASLARLMASMTSWSVAVPISAPDSSVTTQRPLGLDRAELSRSRSGSPREADVALRLTSLSCTWSPRTASRVDPSDRCVVFIDCQDPPSGNTWNRRYSLSHSDSRLIGELEQTIANDGTPVRDSLVRSRRSRPRMHRSVQRAAPQESPAAPEFRPHEARRLGRPT